MNAVTLNLKQELSEHWALAATLFLRTLDAEQFNVNFVDDNTRSFTSTAKRTCGRSWRAFEDYLLRLTNGLSLTQNRHGFFTQFSA